MEQETLTLPEHTSSRPVFSGVRVTQSLVLCVCFVNRCLSFYFWSLSGLFFFDLRILITPLWYFQTLLTPVATNQMPILFTSLSYNASHYHVTQVDFLKLFFTTCIIACNWILRSHDGTMILMNTRENKYYDDRHFGTDPLNALSVSHIPIMHHCM